MATNLTAIASELLSEPPASSPALAVRALIPANTPLSPACCCAVAAFTWVLYDYAVTLRDEVVLVWRQRIRYAAFLFFWVRYIGLLILGALMFIYLAAGPLQIKNFDVPGAIIRTFTPIIQFAVFWAVEIILQCRIYALYGNRRLVIINGVLFVLEQGVMIVLWWFDPVGYHGCSGLPFEMRLSTLCNPYMPIYWVPGIVFELWLAFLAFRKLKFSAWDRDLFHVVVQDSIIYFALIAVVMIIHLAAAFHQLDGFELPFLVAGQTIGGSRLVLQLRKAYYEGHGARHGTTLAAHGVRRGISSLVDESFYARPSHLSGHNPPEWTAPVLPTATHLEPNPCIS